MTVNPFLILGPHLADSSGSESFAIVRQMIDGTMKPGVPGFNLGVVDVRDVAELHLRAGFYPEAEGRYLCSSEDSNFLQIAQSIRRNFGDKYPVPKRTLPKLLVWLVGPMVNQALTRDFVSKNIGHPWHADNGKSVRELSMVYRSLDTRTKDLVEQMT